MAISSPLLETSIQGAKGVLINVTGSMDIGLDEVEQAATLVQQAAHPDANIIFGATFDENMEDEIRVTVIATGFDEGNGKNTIAEKPFTDAEKKVEQAAEEQKAAEEKTGAAEGTQPAAAEAPLAEQLLKSIPGEKEEDDPFDAIFNIFNKRQ